MNWIDILILAPLIWGAYNGFKKGLISQVLGTFGLIIGIWLGTQYPGIVEGFLKEFVDDDYLKIISFVVIFLAVVLVTALLSKLLEKVINFIQLKNKSEPDKSEKKSGKIVKGLLSHGFLKGS